MSNYEETKPGKGGVIANILAALAFLALGICLLVLNADSVSNMIYSFASIAVGACFICFGAYYMIKYFFKKESTTPFLLKKRKTIIDKRIAIKYLIKTASKVKTDTTAIEIITIKPMKRYLIPTVRSDKILPDAK